MFYDIFDGLMISDGGLFLPKHGINAYYYHGCKHSSYVEYILHLGSEEHFSVGENIIKETRKGHQNQDVDFYRGRINTHPFFTGQKKRWYKNKKKCIPEDFVLTPDICLHWYLGDGGLAWSKNYLQRLELATHGFSYDEVKFLCTLLSKHAISSYITFDKNKLPRLMITKRGISQFLDYISPCSVECFKYKWVTSSRQAYNTQKNTCYCKKTISS